MRILVIGGGIFGCCIATELAHDGHEVTLAEKTDELMGAASKANHNRLHLGPHYPRSVVTAKQSIEGLLSFFMHFSRALVTDFPNYYAIAKEGSLTSARDFARFLDEVGVSYREECPGGNYLDCSKIEACFRVQEPIFDYATLRAIVVGRLEAAGVTVALRVRPRLIQSVGWDFVVNATYAGINEVNELMGVRPLDVEFEHVLIPIIRLESKSIGLTVMDGPFCTLMPQGFQRDRFLLYHVEESVARRDEKMFLLSDIIIAESTQWFPFLKDAERVGEYRAMRVVYENRSDARLTEVHTYPERPNFISVLSGKISTAMKTAIHVRHLVAGNPNAANYVI